MKTMIESGKEIETQEQANKHRATQRSQVEEVPEIRDPKPTQMGACWCPGIGKEVVSVSTFPILLGKC